LDIEKRLRELSQRGEEVHFHADGHWDIYLQEDGTCSWNYYCCDYEECNSSDYQNYDNVEQLIENEYLDFNWREVE
jgi:hypothetical protein